MLRDKWKHSIKCWRDINNVFSPYWYTDIATFTYRHKTRHCYFSHREKHISAVLGVQGEIDIFYQRHIATEFRHRGLSVLRQTVRDRDITLLQAYTEARSHYTSPIEGGI
jgi:hypothetical protein